MIAIFFAIAALIWLAAGLAFWRWQPASSRHRDLLVTGLYIPAVLGFFWQLAFLPDVMVPRGGGDLASFLYPVFSYSATQWQQGVVPFWNPHLYGGSPFIADMQTASFYPPNLLSFLLSRPFSYETLELLAVAHYFLAAVFTYAYGRVLGMRRPGAFAFGLIFAYSGFLVAHLGHLNMLEATVWLPLALLCLHRALQPGGLMWSAGAGLALGLSLLAGHNQISLYLAFFLVLYWIWGLGMAWRGPTFPSLRPRFQQAPRDSNTAPGPTPSPFQVEDPSGRRSDGREGQSLPRAQGGGAGSMPASMARPSSLPLLPSREKGTTAGDPEPRRPRPHSNDREQGVSAPAGGTPVLSAALSLPLAGLLAVGVAAVQLLPTLELIPLTVRANITYQQASEFASAPSSLMMLAVPHFFGSSPSAYWGISGNLTELYGYVGILPLALALLALLTCRRRSPWLLFFALAALFFLLLSLGPYTVLHGWLYRFVPGFDKVRAAARFILFFDFGVALLAGFGLDALSQPLAARARPAWRWLSRGLGLVLAGGALVAVPLLYHALLVSLDKDPGVVRAVQEAQQSLNLSVIFLALVLGLLLTWRYHPRLRSWVMPLAVLLVIADLFSANAGYNPTTEDILTNYDHQEAVAYLRQDPAAYRIDTRTNVGDVWQPDLSLLAGVDDIMGIYNPMLLADYQRYIENLPSRSVPAFDLLNVKYVVGHKDIPLDKAKFEVAFAGDPDIDLFVNRQALPRAFLTPAAEVLSREETLARLKRSDFDPRRAVLLEAGEPLAGSGSAGEVRALRRPNGNEVLVELNAAAPAYLLMADVWYPGWKVFVDGAERPLRRADYVFRAVRVDPGEHTVRFVFRPRFWALGLGITLAVLFGMAAAVLLASALGRRRQRGQEQG